MNQISPPSRTEIEEALGLTAARKRRRWLGRVIWLLVLGAIIAAGLYGYQRYSAVTTTVIYDTLPATRGDLVVTVSATGKIQPLTQVDIGSEMSGVVREVRVDDNGTIKRGDVLAILDTVRLEAQKKRSEAQIEAADARLADARAALAEKKDLAERQQTLREKGLSTEQDFETAMSGAKRAEASVNVAAADVSSARADLAMIEADLARSVITSPIDGVVLKRAIEPGQTVAASLQAPVLFTIAQDLARIQLEAAVDEADMGTVKTGQKATFTVDAYRGRSFPAQIESLSFAPETVDGVVTYKAILSAANDDLALRPGMTATARITVEEHAGVLTVVNEALRYRPPREAESKGFSITQLFMPRFPRADRGKREEVSDGRRDIWVLRNGQAEKLSVKTGATDGKRTIIVEGDLKDDDAVISAQRLTP